ncbi:hypothetical protein ACOMHN_048659 [Nucella lapillus]
MEDTLKQLSREIVTPKFAAIKHSCSAALSALQNEEALQATEAWKLRELCLEPLQMALESRARKLSYHALAGIQHLLKDERFHSSLETGDEEHWLPVQVLNALHLTPQLPEEIQVEIMKLLLHMTLTTAWCMNAGIVIKISQLFLKCYCHSPRSKTGRLAAAMFRESVGEWCSRVHGSDSSTDTIRSLLAHIGRNQTAGEKNEEEEEEEEEEEGSRHSDESAETSHEVYIETYRDSMQGVRGPVQAALTQMLSNFMETLREIEEKVVEDGDDMLADFKASASTGNVENAMEEVVTLLKYLTDRLETSQSSSQGRQVLPLLLEGVQAILSKVPSLVRHNAAFQELIWKQLCPVLISLLGVPKVEKAPAMQRAQSHDDSAGKGPTVLAPSSHNLGSAAKIVYSIAAELVRLVGSVKCLRPVLESLFHRILLCPQPQHRLEALRVIKELLGDPERVVDMAMPTDVTVNTKADVTDMALIKLIMAAVEEGSHCNDLSVCFASVTCVDSLLRALDSLGQGQGMADSTVDDILVACSRMERGQISHSQSAVPGEESRGGHQDGDGGSVTTGGQQLSSLSPPDSPRPVVDSDTNSENSMPDVVKRVTRLRLSDIEQDETATPASETETPNHQEAAAKVDKEREETGKQGDSTMEVSSSREAGKGKDSQSASCVEEAAEPDQETVPLSPARKALQEESERVERRNAEEFVHLLRSCAPQLMSLLCITDVDDALQTFASNFCSGLSEQQCHQGSIRPEMSGLVLNADGVYTASIAALKLSYALSKGGYYTTRQHHLLPQSQCCTQHIYHIIQRRGVRTPVAPGETSAGTSTVNAPSLLTCRPASDPFPLLCTRLQIKHGRVGRVAKVQFVDGVLGSGLLLYLSPTWLSELYQQTLTCPLMDVTHLSMADCPLLQMLEDVDGLGSHEIGGQLMYEFRWDEGVVSCDESPEMRLKVEAGQTLARIILSTCWEAILDVVSVLLDGKSSCGITFSLGLLLGTEGAREETQRGRDAICLSLTGLQTASKLCCKLGLQSKCTSAFAQLASTSCVREDGRTSGVGLGEGKGGLKAAMLREKPRPVRLHASHVLSMDVMMVTGMEVGSHAADCWKHVFRCCAHISELEHTYFSQGNHESSLPRVQQGRTADTEGPGDIDGVMEMEPIMLTGAAVPVAPRISVGELIRQSGMECGWDTSLTGGGVLTPQHAARALCGLSQEVDSLFEDAAKKLNLKALLNFLTELGESSRLQLRHLQHHHVEPTDTSNMLTPGHPGPGQGSRLPMNALHLYRLQQALMMVVHSQRPLLHLVRVWAAVSPYLVEATGHRDSSISKMAVTCIHDFIVAVLAGRHELPHFHINEFLCKTFEDMLCLELCDSDVQDQIVCSICELVEACTQELQSGWRPLFGALRSVRIEYTANEAVNEARQRHVAAVLDVFEVYLDTEDILVFANATVDCILCLLKYVHGSGMFEDTEDDDDDGSDSGSDVGAVGVNLQNLCVPALGYLARCCRILASMWPMPACPVFKGAFRIQLGSHVRTVDPHIPHMDLSLVAEPPGPAKSGKTGDAMATKPTSVGDSLSITSVDSGMLEGMSETEDGRKGGAGQWLQAGSYSTLESLDRRSGVLHVWYLLLDGLATAISSCPRSFQPQTLTTLFTLLRDTAAVPGVKFSLHCVNHLLLPMLQSWLRRGSRLHGYWDTGAVNFKQCCGLTADLVVEFIAKFVDQAEEIPTLELMLKQLFAVLTECVAQPVENLSLLGSSCIRHVMLSAGPILTESMWAISACCLAHAVAVTTHNLRQLMALFHPNSDNFYGDIGQVKVATRKDCVAMDNMRLKQLARQVLLLESQVTSMPSLQFDLEEDKSFVFLVYPPDHTDSLNPDHISARVPLRDMIVGLLSNQLLLQTLGSLLLDPGSDPLPPLTKALCQVCGLRGLMRYMSTRNVLSFMDILESLYRFAVDFDVRPGLKFLLQKVAGLEVAANQYRLAGASTVLYLHALTHLCSALSPLDMLTVTTLLQQQQQRDRMDVETGPCKDRDSQNTETGVKREETGSEKGGKNSQLQSLEKPGKREETGSEKGGKEQEDARSRQAEAASEEGGKSEAASGGARENKENGKAEDHKATADTDNETKEKDGVKDSHPNDQSSPKAPENANSSHATENADSSHATETPKPPAPHAPPPPPPPWKQQGSVSKAKPWDSSDVFLPMLKEKCDSICRQYVDILADGQTESLVDRMSGRPLFFLLAQPEDISEITRPLLRKSSDVSKKGKNPGGGEGGAGEGEKASLVGTVVASSPQMPFDQAAEGSSSMATPGDSTFPVSKEPPPTQQSNKDAKSENAEEDSKRKMSKRQRRADQESKVYSVATDTVIQNLIGQYKRRKLHNTMPSTQVQFARHHRPAVTKVTKVPRREPVDEAIDKQQQTSIMKDSEARQRSWSEMLVTVLQLFLRLGDPDFQALLPVVSPCVTRLIRHAHDSVLRDTLAQWFRRLGNIYHFLPPEKGENGKRGEAGEEGKESAC